MCFLYRFQLFKVVIECLPEDNQSKEEMLTACRLKYSSNEHMLNNIDEFDRTYRIDECIRWYTKDTFLYKMINEALRTEDIQQLCTFRYYIADLSKQLAQNYQILKNEYQKKICLYRGVPLRKKEIEKLKASKGQLIAINGYWSTSLDRECAKSFANKLSDYQDAVPILFEINCDLHECNDSVIFADISSLSQFQTEQEFLFDAGSIFRIDDIKEEKSDKGKLYLVQITTSGEGREIVKEYIEEIREEMKYESPRIMLGVLMKRAGNYKTSLQYYEQLLKHPGEEKISHIHNRIGIALKVDREYDLALEHFDKAYKLISKSDPSERVYLAQIRHSQGQIYVKQKNFTKALTFYKEAVNIAENILNNKNRYTAKFYASIGRLYLSCKSFDRAICYQQKALEIREFCFSPENVIHAISYDDIGNIYLSLNNYKRALEFHHKALELRQKYLPPVHHNTAWSLHCVAKTYHSMGDSKTALDYYSKALEMTKKCPSPSQHYIIAKTLDNIRSICDYNSEESLNYRLEALEVQKDTKPIDYSKVARLYDDIGFTCKSIGRNDDSLKFYQEALQIRKETLSNVHFDLSYSF